MKKIILPLLLFTAQFAIGQLSNLNLESWTTTANGPEPSEPATVATRHYPAVQSISHQNQRPLRATQG